jgi:hypothetical protein
LRCTWICRAPRTISSPRSGPRAWTARIRSARPRPGMTAVRGFRYRRGPGSGYAADWRAGSPERMENSRSVTTFGDAVASVPFEGASSGGVTPGCYSRALSFAAAALAYSKPWLVIVRPDRDSLAGKRRPVGFLDRRWAPCIALVASIPIAGQGISLALAFD